MSRRVVPSCQDVADGLIRIEVTFYRSVRDPDVDDLVSETLAGRPEAWRLLWQAVEPTLYATLRRPNLLGRLSQSEDDCRNIVLEVMGRLQANQFARLAQFAETRRQNPKLPFMGWLIVVAKRVAIDYLRAHETYIDRRHVEGASSPGAWRDVGSLPSDSQLPGERPPVTSRGTAHELFDFAAAELPEAMQQALAAWLEGQTFEEIAAGGDAKQAEKTVRAALERLRRHFRPQEP